MIAIGAVDHQPQDTPEIAAVYQPHMPVLNEVTRHHQILMLRTQVEMAESDKIPIMFRPEDLHLLLEMIVQVPRIGFGAPG